MTSESMLTSPLPASSTSASTGNDFQISPQLDSNMQNDFNSSFDSNMHSDAIIPGPSTTSNTHTPFNIPSTSPAWSNNLRAPSTIPDSMQTCALDIILQASIPDNMQTRMLDIYPSGSEAKEASDGSTLTDLEANKVIKRPLSTSFMQGPLIKLTGPRPPPPQGLSVDKPASKVPKKQGKKAKDVEIDPNTTNAKELFGIQWLSSLGPEAPRSMTALNTAWKALGENGKKEYKEQSKRIISELIGKGKARAKAAAEEGEGEGADEDE